MAQVFMKYNPYRMRTELKVNGNAIEADSDLIRVVKGKRLQEWIGEFPQMLVDNLNTKIFEVTFYGLPLDWDDVQDAFQIAESKGVIQDARLYFQEGRSDEDIHDRIVQVFNNLQEGPVDDFKHPRLIRAFKDIDSAIFPIHVGATMSSGKSTLINALLGKKLMPSKNEACTATITEILDNDQEHFAATVYDEAENIIESISDLTYEDMSRLNEDEKVHRIFVEGNIPFLDARSTALKLVDTPGPNNSQNQEHKNATYKAINSDSNSLILYVLNGTQLSTYDDASLLKYVAGLIQKGGKQMRDRFLFVVNKMDSFDPEEEDIGHAIDSAREYLEKYGIEDPQIFPCSAYTALNARIYLQDMNLRDVGAIKLSRPARKAKEAIEDFVEEDTMHLETYSTLPPSAQRDLDFRLEQAKKKDDWIEQGLIHCGIYSIEEAITAYVKKYAKTKKIKDLVECYEQILESNQVLAKVKIQVANDQKAAEDLARRVAAIEENIANGKEAAVLKKTVMSLNPMGIIWTKVELLRRDVERHVSGVFAPYGDTISSKEDARSLVDQFGKVSSDAIAVLSSELEKVIDQEIRETGERLLQEYIRKLEKIDESVSSETLDFGTADLIKGVLGSMRETVDDWGTGDFATSIVDEYGEVTYDEKVNYVKVGEEEEEVVDGTKEVKVGTRKKLLGTQHKKVGTRRVRNPEKRWWKIFTPKYIEEDVYKTIEDYKDEDVYRNVIQYKSVMRDIFEEQREQIESYSAETADIQAGLLGELRRSLDEGIDKTVKYGEEQVRDMKVQFTDLFDKLDDLIRAKYSELEGFVKDQEGKEAQLQQNRQILDWLEACREEIEGILSI